MDSAPKQQLSITTDDPFYCAGDTVTGTACLILTEPTQIDHILVKITGKIYFTTPFILTTVDVVNFEKSIELKCAAGDEPVGPGKHPFPFAIKLKGNENVLLASVKYTAFPFMVRYVVEAEARKSSAPGDCVLKAEKEVLICQRTPSSLPEPKNVSCEQVVMSCLVYYKGSVTLAARSVKSACLSGEECAMQLMIDARKCEVDLTTLTLELHEDVMFTLNNNTEPLATATNQIANTKETILVKAGTIVNKVVKLLIPEKCIPSTTSTMFRVAHFIRVAVSAPLCNDAAVKTPVFVRQKRPS
jgi:hypothetical protein